jgi:hypothetical protein
MCSRARNTCLLWRRTERKFQGKRTIPVHNCPVVTCLYLLNRATDKTLSVRLSVGLNPRGSARTVHVRCIYSPLGREIVKCTVIYGVYKWFWPTLIMMDTMMATKVQAVTLACAGERMGRWMNGQVNECAGEWMCRWMNVQVHECAGEWMCRWMSGQLK